SSSTDTNYGKHSPDSKPARAKVRSPAVTASTPRPSAVYRKERNSLTPDNARKLACQAFTPTYPAATLAGVAGQTQPQSVRHWRSDTERVPSSQWSQTAHRTGRGCE